MLSSPQRRTLLLVIIALLFFASLSKVARAQSGRTMPRPTPTPQEREPQEPIRVFTEEVRLPIFVTDNEGRFDPTLELPDIIVLEDDEMQEVRSVRRVPANVLLVLD